ncbi:hypothetical protein B0H14DRAFT_2619439 [Mycena olivaceomarginata]|nr:hypothetical protein B0H14DRAFT_2619439 [Mycena olivaceomarginata]
MYPSATAGYIDIKLLADSFSLASQLTIVNHRVQNGEKTNPGLIEQILTQDPCVKADIMFGHEQPHAGIIIAVSKDVCNVELFWNAIWYTQRMFCPLLNERMPSNQMIVLAMLSRPFQVTAKGTPHQQAILEDYTPDINTAYVALDCVAAPASNQAHREISVNEALEIVQEHVHINVGPSISDHDNIFNAGAESVSVGASAIPDDTPYKHIPALIVDNKEMIVCLCEAVAGGTGFIYSFVHLQMHFRTGLWAIQVVPETPCTSFVSQTDFYYRKIKETQPMGLYHIRGYFRGYSAGVFMLTLLAIALCTIDTYTTEIDFADLETLKHTVSGVTRGGTSFLTAYGSGGNSRMRAEQMAELMVAVYENAVEGSARAFEFILSFAGEHRVYLEVVCTMIVWMREASHSIVAGVAPEAQKEWWGLGLDWCFTDLQVVEVDAGHDNILKQDKVMQDLQTSLT